MNLIREPIAYEANHIVAKKAGFPSNACQIGLLNWTKEITQKSGRDEASRSEEEFVTQFGLINVNKEGRGLQFGLLNFSSEGFLPCSPILNF